MVKKKNKIVVEPFDDIRIVGITTQLEDYKLAWHINNVLGIDLAKYDDIVDENGEPFSFYLYDEGDNCNAYNLVAISNGEAKYVIIKPATDFIFVIRNFMADDVFSQIVEKLKKIPGVVYSYIIGNEQLKKLGTLLEDVELHELYLAKKEE